MSSESNMSTELRAVESLLKQFSPVESAMNRDATFYEAGWAAASAMQAPSKPHWLWPATSGALAASLLMFIAFPPASPIQRAETEPIASTYQAQQPAANPPATSTDAQPAYTFTYPPKRFSSSAPFLAMRERALRMEFDEPANIHWADDDSATKAITARELLQELLGETS